MPQDKIVLLFLFLNCIFLCNAFTVPLRVLAHKVHTSYKENMCHFWNSHSYQQKTTLKSELIEHKATAKKDANALIRTKIIMGTVWDFAIFPHRITKIIEEIYTVRRHEIPNNQDQTLL